MSRSLYIGILVAGLLLACEADESTGNTPPADNTFAYTATPLSETSLETLKTFAQLSGQQDMDALLRYSVKTFRITYQTTYKDTPIKASGLLFVPAGLTGNAPIISLQHGTTFVKDDAPSVSGTFSGMEYFAAAGYIAVMPDFIGYGESSDIFHPYYDEQYAASAVIDMIKQTKVHLAKEGIAFNDQLFLAGYSEGGYVTLAAAKEIETDKNHGLKLTAVAAGAGGYDLTEMLRSVTTQSHYTYPSYLAFVIMSYNTTYDWDRPLSDYFGDKYAKALSVYMNGEHDGWTINKQLTTSVSDLLNPDFYSGLKAAGAETAFKKALADNSVAGWSTKIPIRLYHGTRDEVIPYQNSEATLAKFKAAGSTDVSLTLIPSGTHGSSFVPMLQQFIPWFETFR